MIRHIFVYTLSVCSSIGAAQSCFLPDNRTGSSPSKLPVLRSLYFPDYCSPIKDSRTKTMHEAEFSVLWQVIPGNNLSHFFLRIFAVQNSRRFPPHSLVQCFILIHLFQLDDTTIHIDPHGIQDIGKINIIKSVPFDSQPQFRLKLLQKGCSGPLVIPMT